MGTLHVYISILTCLFPIVKNYEYHTKLKTVVFIFQNGKAKYINRMCNIEEQTPTTSYPFVLNDYHFTLNKNIYNTDYSQSI